MMNRYALTPHRKSQKQPRLQETKRVVVPSIGLRRSNDAPGEKESPNPRGWRIEALKAWTFPRCAAVRSWLQTIYTNDFPAMTRGSI